MLRIKDYMNVHQDVLYDDAKEIISNELGKENQDWDNDFEKMSPYNAPMTISVMHGRSIKDEFKKLHSEINELMKKYLKCTNLKNIIQTDIHTTNKLKIKKQIYGYLVNKFYANNDVNNTMVEQIKEKLGMKES